VNQPLATALADRYRIERELGQGGMATVYLAEDLRHKRKVALKVLKPELAAVLGAERFVQEITTTASLSHPHILPLFDSGEVAGFLFYVMPFVEGETLRDKLSRETQLGVDEAVRITTEVADALQYAHEHGVIHRDIKPENILLQSGRPMVADFGIALALSAAAGGRMTETGLSLGTPHYMSPEQATAEKEITARSDVYSLASVCYEMLAGQPPHLGGSAQQIIMKIIAEPVEAVTRYRKAVPPNVAAALGKALEKLPADRFDSAAAFARALGDPGFTSGAMAGVSAAQRADRRRDPLVLSLGAAAVLAAGLALWSLTRHSPQAPLVQYILGLEEAEAPTSAAPAIGGRLALSPDGMTLVYVGGDQARVGIVLYVRRRGQLHAIPMKGTDGARRPVFSPEGGRVAYFSPGGNLYVTSPDGGAIQHLTNLVDDDKGGTWSDDGFIYATGHGGRDLLRIAPDGGTPQVVATVDSAAGERTFLRPRAIAGGRAMLVAVQGEGGEYFVVAVDLRSGKHHRLAPGIEAWYVSTGHFLYATADGHLMAAPFDANRLELTGQTRLVLDSIGVSRLGAEVTISESGTLMYLVGTAGYGVQPEWVDRSGKGEPVDSSWVYTTASIYSTMVLSPDETRLAVSQDAAGAQHLFVKRLPRGPSQQLTFEGRLNTRATWAPDGKSLMYISDRSGTNSVWRRVADGSSPAERVSAQFANEGFLSPDGGWFVYRGIAPDRHIYARRVTGDTTTIVVARSATGEDLAPTLSPDGRWIAYTSTETGRSEIVVRPFPEVSKGKVQISPSGGIEPRWSRDGHELFFRNEANELMSARVSGGAAGFVVETVQRLFSMRDFLPENLYQATYDVTRDGRRFVMGRVLRGTGGERLIVVENFVQHLKEMLAR